MFEKKSISEIKDWSHIDYVCIKAKSGDLFEDIYYLDGHKFFESSLTEADINFINFTRGINSYGISEKMVGESSTLDRFYVRVNISNKQQELRLIDYLCQGYRLTLKQKELLDHLRNMDSIIKSFDDYHPLYYCGFSKMCKSLNYNNIRFYFKTFTTDESIEIFNKYPPASISISIYGKDEESYFRVTGQNGMYNKVINTLKMLSQNSIHFEIKYIGMRENQDDYPAICSLAERYGAEFSYSMELFPTLNGNECTKNHMISLEKIIEIEKEIPGKKEEYRRLSEIPNPFVNQKDVPLYLCDMAISNFLVDYQGYLNPCHKCRFKKWNLLSDDFNIAWADYKLLLKEKASKNNKCLKCKYLMMCSPCIVVNYLSTGDYNTPAETVCQLTHLRVNMCNSID